MNDKIKETFYARFCGTPEEYALSALEFVCSEADRLEAENAELKDRISQAEKMADIRKLVKPLVWSQYAGDEDGYEIIHKTTFSRYYKLQIIELNEQISIFLFDDCVCQDFKGSIEEAKNYAYEKLCELVANVCGLESEAQNG